MTGGIHPYMGNNSHKDEATVDVEPESSWVTALTYLSGDHAGEKIAFKGESFTIGRAKGNSLVLNDKAVSRRHAAIQLKDNRYHIYDLGSRWGLLLNGSKTAGSELKFGDEIEIAGARFTFGLVQKDSVTPQRTNWAKIAVMILIFAAVATTATLFYFKHITKENLDRPGADVVSQIIYHYDKGISYYNMINQDPSNRQKAIEEMKKVIELDPDQKTQFSLSARRIIDGLEK